MLEKQLQREYEEQRNRDEHERLTDDFW
jgi:hypothetical protein